MALTATQLRDALRLGTDADTLAQVTRLLAVATAAVEEHAPAAPDAFKDEAVVRLAGYWFDQPNFAEGSGTAAALRNSGAGDLLLKHRAPRARSTSGATPTTTSSGEPGVDLAARDAAAAARAIADANAAKLAPPSESEADAATATTIRGWTAALVRRVVEAVVPQWARQPSASTGPAYGKGALLGTQSILRSVEPLDDSALIVHPDDISLTMADSPPEGVAAVSETASHYIGLPTVEPPSGVNCVIVEVSETADGAPYFSSAIPWMNTWGREIVRFGSGSGYFYVRAIADTRDRTALVVQKGTADVPIGTTVRWRYGALGGRAGSTSGAGLDQAAVDARVQAGVLDWAETGNTSRIPTGKAPMPATNSEAETGTSTTVRSWTSALIRRAIHAVVPEWARTGNAATLPDAKLAARIARTSAIPDTTGLLNQSQVDARVQSGVADWAETGNGDPIPAAKLSNAEGGGGGWTELTESPITGYGSSQSVSTVIGTGITSWVNYDRLKFIGYEEFGSSARRVWPSVEIPAADLSALTALTHMSGNTYRRTNATVISIARQGAISGNDLLYVGRSGSHSGNQLAIIGQSFLNIRIYGQSDA